MKEKIFSYENEDIKVTWDLKRCIHAAECVRGLPDVFAPKRKPWIMPDNGDTDEIKRVISKCPTGALHYQMKQTDDTEEPPEQNVLTIKRNGPIYIHGNVMVRDQEGNVILQDTRVAMCRCGKSENKPFCDNSHIDADFQADTSFNEERLRTEPVKGKGGELSITLYENSPFLVEGNYDLVGRDTGTETTSKKMSFCRCGGSNTKPFCDGTHKKIGFDSK